MTELAPSVHVRFCVGITSVLRRCAAGGLFGLCLLPNVAFADYTGNDMVRAAFEHRVPKIENADGIGTDKLRRFEGLAIPHVKDDIRLSAKGWVWAGETKGWYLSQKAPVGWSFDCTVVSDSPIVDEPAATWNAYLANNEEGFGNLRPAVVGGDEGWACGRAGREAENRTTELIFCAVEEVDQAPWAAVQANWIFSERNEFSESFCRNRLEDCR